MSKKTAKVYTLADVERLISFHGGGSLVKIKRNYGTLYRFSVSINGKIRYLCFGRRATFEMMYHEIAQLLRFRFQSMQKFGVKIEPTPSKLRFQELLKWYMASHDDIFSRNKRATMLYSGKKFLSFLQVSRMQKIPANQIRWNDIVVYRRWLLEQGFAASTAVAMLYRLRVIFAAGVRARKISNYPFLESHRILE